MMEQIRLRDVLSRRAHNAHPSAFSAQLREKIPTPAYENDNL
jgi:hypothetical protein